MILGIVRFVAEEVTNPIAVAVCFAEFLGKLLSDGTKFESVLVNEVFECDILAKWDAINKDNHKTIELVKSSSPNKDAIVYASM